MSELKLQQCRLDGRYDIIECLGRGSYSEVYLARDMAASHGAAETIVIKALNSSLQGIPDPELERTLLENFRNEAVALDRVRHPHIISRLGHGTAIDLQGRTFHYLVFEYLPGGDLQALCRQHPLTLERALFYIEQVCAGLEYAHQHGVIHRDIKPHNLLLTADREIVKIADFGVAKIEATEGTITRVGTDVYAAPEHHPLAQTGPLDTARLSVRIKQLTPAADVYSLAKTFYMLLAGETPRRFSQRQITELPESINGKEWSRFVLRVLQRATETDSQARYQTVREFWEELKDATMPATRTLQPSGSADILNSSFEPESGTPTAHPSAQHSAPPSPAPPPIAPPPLFESHHNSSHAARSVAAATTPPPPRPRIVVPIAHSSRVEQEVIRSTAVENPKAMPRPAPLRTDEAPPERRRARLSPRARSWLVGLLLVISFAGILYALLHYARGYRSDTSAARTTTNPAAAIGREFLTTTDVNLRQGPSRTTSKVGMANGGSRVRVLRVSGGWYEVVVVEYAGPKEELNASDQGWLNNGYLRTN
ncbi:MAG: serine/threonine protein kinase [Acidobacteriota bacterium]|nr:serine/threonine protein kinase [Acidobacteriota bacterium]